ncbi:MAG: DUF1349 domain-containing protein [Chloroflexi bacterium]|nr:DUF1349 domain-containing protein [Chloroflexota bacterium]
MKRKRLVQVSYIIASLLVPFLALSFIFSAANAEPTSIKSDDFKACSLDTDLWSFVNPVGDGSVSMSGTQAMLTAPAGASHDVWSSGNFAPRLMQAANDADFAIEVKFESIINQAFQLQGVIIEEDSDDFLRFDFYHDGGSARVFAASFVNGTPTAQINTPLPGAAAPMYLRVSRVDDQWTQRYSFDGLIWTTAVTFTHALQVNQIGPFVGNAGSNPAHTAIIDYFFNTASPINPEDGQTISHTLSVNTIGGGSVAADPNKPNYDCNETAVLTATADPNWSFAANPTNTLTINTVGQGIVTADPSQSGYFPSEQVTLTTTPDPAWEFAYWTVASSWWDKNWSYRLPIEVNANGYQRNDKPVEVTLNFTQILTALGESGPFDINSLRVVEVDAAEQVIDAAVPLQFDADADFDAATNASGTLIFLMAGDTAANADRAYHIYFDVTGSGFTSPAFTPQITLTDNVIDEGQISFQIDTSNASYFYHKQAGGFSSLVDANGNDWINFHPTGGSAGSYRGIPNLVYPHNYFHPGFTHVTSSIINQGPLKASVQSVTDNNLWEVMWEFYPRYARLTVMRINDDYWFLYEGTPGGSLDTATDIVVRSDGTQILAGGSWTGDIVGEEWVYFGDPNVGRSLYAVNHEDDTAVDSYYPMHEEMTVFGFGRDGTNSSLNQAPAQFTIGLADTTAFSPTAESIYSAYKDLAVVTGTAESTISDMIIHSPALVLTMTRNQVVTATFTAIPTHTLSVNVVGNGSATVSPNQSNYLSGTQVTLTATAVVNWEFSNWSGDISGGVPTETLTMDGDKIVTATFTAIPTYTLTVNKVGNGSVAITPDQTDYLRGAPVTLTATADPAWEFSDWSGDISSGVPTETLTMDGNKIVTATFTAIPTYTLTVNKVGNGSITVTPDQSEYLSGTQVILTATAASHWVFSGWSGDLVSGAISETIIMTRNQVVTATFVQNPLYLTLDIIGGGIVSASPDQAAYVYGDVVTLTATADPGWEFSGWNGDLTGDTLSETVVMTTDKTVTATFTAIPTYTLTVNTVGNGTAVIVPDQTEYLSGTSVSLTATAVPSWRFAGWSGDLTGDAAVETLIMNSDKVVTATFVAIPTYTLTVNAVGNGSVAVSPNQTEYLEGSLVTLTPTAVSGWVFSSWSGDIIANDDPLSFYITEDMTLTATFSLKYNVYLPMIVR